MAIIDDYINVTITKGTLGVTTSSLNTLLVIGDSRKLDAVTVIPRVKSYGSLAEVQADYTTSTFGEVLLATAYFSQDPKPSKLIIGRVVAAETFADAYPLIALEDNSFYGLAITSKVQSQQLLIAALAQANNKLFGVSGGEVAYLTASSASLAKALKDGNYSRTFAMYSAAMCGPLIVPSGTPEGAAFGALFSKDAGSATWAYKNLKGVVSDKLTTANREQLKLNNCNFYTPFAGVDVFLNGTTSSGDFIDIIQGGDWLAANIQAKIATCLLNSDKIPYTNAGINIIESQLRLALNEGVARNIVDQQSVVITVPSALEVSSADRAARTLNVSFEARFQGAIHIVGIKGTISV